MSRLGSRGITVVASSLIMFLFGCGGGTSTTNTPGVIPVIVTLSPSPDVSMDIGNTVSFTADAQDSGGNALSPSPLISFVSSNPNVVQVAASGLACAGKWDSLTNPQICTAGTVGEAVVTATSSGVTSPPATVHVHQHIDSIAITPVVTSTPTPSCVSKTLTLDYQVAAFNRGLDITSTVGPFSWNSVNQLVATVSTSASGLSPAQARVTAVNPGMTGVFVTAAGVNSPTAQFITCPVKSIALTVENTTQTSFIEQSGAKNITATVVDSSNTAITGVNLTWSTSDAAAFTATGTGTTGSASSVKPGSATIIASCLPPACNIGFPTPITIYPQNVITGTNTGTTATPAATSVWVASTECGVLDATTQLVVNSNDCVSSIFPIDTTTNTLGVGIDLPVVPNSLQFDRQSTKAYLGTDSGRLGTTGLSIVTPASTTQAAPTVSSVTTAPGKILTISPDGQNVIVSDTVDVPNQVSVVTGGSTVTTLPITGATAAAFAPDNSKAYIVAGSNLYVYSASQALKKITLTAPATDVTFLASGAFAYLGGGSAGHQLTVFKTCDNRPALDDAGNSEDVSSLTFTPTFVKASADNTKVLAFNTAGVDLIGVTTMGSAATGATATAQGCAPQDLSATPPLNGGLPTVANVPGPSFNFGQGNFTPTQLIVSSNGARAYVLARNLSSIIAFSAESQTTSTIQLSGNSVPIQASLSTDGNTLYVIARDIVTKVNSIHPVDTRTNNDTNQIVLSQNLCHARTGTSGTFTCDANLIAVKP